MARTSTKRQRMRRVYFIPRKSKFFTPKHGETHFQTIRCTRSAEDDRQFALLLHSTLGADRSSAKLQKEHTEGHASKSLRICEIRPGRQAIFTMLLGFKMS